MKNLFMILTVLGLIGCYSTNKTTYSYNWEVCDDCITLKDIEKYEAKRFSKKVIISEEDFTNTFWENTIFLKKDNKDVMYALTDSTGFFQELTYYRMTPLTVNLDTTSEDFHLNRLHDFRIFIIYVNQELKKM